MFYPTILTAVTFYGTYHSVIGYPFRISHLSSFHNMYSSGTVRYVNGRSILLRVKEFTLTSYALSCTAHLNIVLGYVEMIDRRVPFYRIPYIDAGDATDGDKELPWALLDRIICRENCSAIRLGLF